MKKNLSLIALLIFTLNVNSQTPKQVCTFPEDYIGKIITFKNIRYWPILNEKDGYYNVQIDITSSLADEADWGFGPLTTIKGVVGKVIAKQMINKDIGGYNKYYFGAVTGSVIRTTKTFGQDYLFVIKKIINHPEDMPNDIIDKFEEK